MRPHACPYRVDRGREGVYGDNGGWAPWPPRHCAACGACEADSGHVYDRRPGAGTGERRYAKAEPADLVCWPCLQTIRADQPEQLALVLA